MSESCDILTEVGDRPLAGLKQEEVVEIMQSMPNGKVSATVLRQ